MCRVCMGRKSAIVFPLRSDSFVMSVTCAVTKSQSPYHEKEKCLCYRHFPVEGPEREGEERGRGERETSSQAADDGRNIQTAQDPHQSFSLSCIKLSLPLTHTHTRNDELLGIYYTAAITVVYLHEKILKVKWVTATEIKL